MYLACMCKSLLHHCQAALLFFNNICSTSKHMMGYKRSLSLSYIPSYVHIMKIGMYIILCVHAVCLQMHPYLNGNIRETWARAFSLLVL